MNIMHKVTLTNLKKNKKRTIITILGTAVAVAMITALSVLTATYLNYGAKTSANYNGSWHMAYSYIDLRALPVLQEANKLKTMDVSREATFIQLPPQNDKTRKMLALAEYDGAGLQNLQLEVTEGSLPQNPGELLLSDDFKEYTGLNWQPGDTISLTAGVAFMEYEDEEGIAHKIPLTRGFTLEEIELQNATQQTYTIAGYAKMPYWIEGGYQNTYTALSVFDASEAKQGEFTLSAYLTLQKAGQWTFEESDRLKDELIELYKQEPGYQPNIRLNTDLMAYSGAVANLQVLSSILPFVVLLLLIVLVGSVSLIRNAFSISLSERVRMLGMLAGVGATRRQKRSSVFFEALVIGLFSIPAGIAGGLAGIGITLWLLRTPMENLFGGGDEVALTMVVPLWSILFTVLFSAGILLLAARKPASRAAKIAPVEAVRGSEGDKIARPIKVSNIMRRLFGFEAELGIKNSKRSRKRYIAILSSLVISVVLFLTASAAIQYIQQGLGLARGGQDYNVYSSLSNYDTLPANQFWQKGEEYSAKVRLLPNAGRVYMSAALNGFFVDMPPEDIIAHDDEMKNPDGTYATHINLQIVDDDTFAQYSQDAGIAAPKAGQAGVIALTGRSVRTQNGGWQKDYSVKIAKGDTVGVYTYNATQNKTKIQTLQIAAITEKEPVFLQSSTYPAGWLTLIVRQSDLPGLLQSGQQATEGDAFHLDNGIEFYFKSDDASQLYTQLQDMAVDEEIYAYNFNVQQNAQRNNMAMLILRVFAYGFVALISLVCTANIFNTVSTGIALRTREFAMLRSAGLTPKGFNKMLDCETLFYGVKALLWGVPISVLLSWLLYGTLQRGFAFSFSLPWVSYAIAVAGVFVIVGSSVLYARRKIKKLNIAETLKNENW